MNNTEHYIIMVLMSIVFMIIIRLTRKKNSCHVKCINLSNICTHFLHIPGLENVCTCDRKQHCQ